MTAYELRISDWSSDVCSSDLGSDPDDPAGAMGGEIVCRTCGMLKPLVEQRTAEPPQHSSGRRYWDANRTVHSWGVLRKTLIGRRGVVVLCPHGHPRRGGRIYYPFAPSGLIAWWHPARERRHRPE